ncbi:hypothetical protein JI735_17120 [Paenibacillus sonchi]|uniref:Uncharacterized protein n=1 Tax=Paenibacillus sonchi TaxID=373687 RepID=A0A974P7I7_9BACL|nr:hypothetical protein [Paenibacillus sonchi]QQZ58531.1 hypothetical protein JI735_17120 [Paenibacillus sonchi]
MCKDELTSEELFLKEGDHSDQLPLVDVHDSVMEAIGLGNDRLMMEHASQLQAGNTPDIMQSMEPVVEAERYRKRTMRRHAGRWAAVLILIALLGGGYSLFVEGPGQAAKFQYEVLPYQPLVVAEEGGRWQDPTNQYTFRRKKLPRGRKAKKKGCFRKNIQRHTRL